MPVTVGGGVRVGMAVSVADTDVAISSPGVASTGLAHDSRINPKIIDTMLKIRKYLILKFDIESCQNVKIKNICVKEPLQYSMNTRGVWSMKISSQFCRV